jgi:hypothetical protein
MRNLDAGQRMRKLAGGNAAGTDTCGHHPAGMSRKQSDHSSERFHVDRLLQPIHLRSSDGPYLMCAGTQL